MGTIERLKVGRSALTPGLTLMLHLNELGGLDPRSRYEHFKIRKENRKIVKFTRMKKYSDETWQLFAAVCFARNLWDSTVACCVCPMGSISMSCEDRVMNNEQERQRSVRSTKA